MTSGLHAMIPLLMPAAPAAHGGGSFPVAEVVSGLGWAGWILWLPALATALCGVCAALRIRTKLPAWICVAGLGGAFVTTLVLYARYDPEHGPMSIHLLDWFDLSWADQSFVAAFGLYVDQLTLLWMLFVTGIGTLIALYASEYMEADVKTGYARFFAGISVFLVAMSCLVMGNNLLMLYLGWEGVGFASYWLIGYYYRKPSAVAAAKKAFIVNRIGDLGLALGLYLTWHYFGTIEYTTAEHTGIFDQLRAGVDAETAAAGGWMVRWIPFLFMLGAFGKSAQIPLYVWLPDAMEGPTPVSALIHAATMVTAGVYLVARMLPIFLLNPDSLTVVAWIGGLTALLSATIAMAQYDIKRIMAYSTVSQLGYMFLGLGVLASVGAAYHVFTHAFFKAVLFLTCGAIMHGFAGQLDLRRVSGLMKMRGWRITAMTMGYACLCLAGFPLVTNGFYSKDQIMAQAFITPGFRALGIIAMVTALLTAYYAFRVFFRVCMGAPHYEMGDEHHGEEDAAGAEGHEHARPHAPRWAINLVLILITVGAVGSIFLGGWAERMVTGSTAAVETPHVPMHGFWEDPHRWMPWLASLTTILGITIAWFFHLAQRRAADRVRGAMLANPLSRWLPTAMEHKWYVDELYHALIRAPLWVLGHTLYLLDRYLVDMVLVDGIARIPRWLGRGFQPLANGMLHSYAVSMAGGVGLVVVLVLFMPDFVVWLKSLLGGAG